MTKDSKDKKVTKDTLYVEADDEITSVIDRVVSSKNKVVAVVLPKRAPVFQSAVNMKLLKKSSDEAKKNLVVISSDESIKSIAAVASIHVAKTLNSKPEIPKKSKSAASETTIAADELDTPAKSDEPAKPQEAVTSKETSSDEEDVIKIDNSSDAASSVSDEGSVRKTPKVKIPDFTSFRMKLGFGIVVIALLIGGWVYGFVIAPRATVTISTDTSKTTVAYQFTASTDAQVLDVENRVVPAKIVEIEKQNSVTIEATGEKNTGEKATGSMTITNCSSSSYTVSAGDQFTSAGVTFTADQGASIPKSSYSFTLNGFECDENGAGTVDVTAAEPGTTFNVSAGSYAISSSPSNVSAFGSAMSGGTDSLVTVVSADDIKNARAQLQGSSSAEAKAELETQLAADGMKPLDQTLEEGTPDIKDSVAEGAEVSELTVTQTVTYVMLGVSNDDLNSVLDAELTKQLEADQNNKDIRNNGFETAALRLVNKISTGQQILELQTVATLGEKFDIAAIAQEVAGLPRGEIESLLEARDSVRTVDVEYSPGWITTTPKSAEKITIVVNEIEN